MTWIKICGITNLDDALLAVDAGADAVGFVFHKKSPRNMDPEAVKQIVEKLPESVEKIGVFVGGEFDSSSIFLDTGLTGTQTYLLSEKAGETEQNRKSSAIGQDLLKALGLWERVRFIVALPTSLNGEDVEFNPEHFDKMRTDIDHMPAEFSVDFLRLMGNFLLDSGDLRQPGGTGQTFDWQKAQPVSEAMRRNGFNLVVAGGLTPDNVCEAIETLHPFGVDVASGVEASPGKKDPQKVRAFVNAVREQDRKAS